METKAACADEGVIHGGGRTKMSGQETIERMSLLGDAGENNQVKKPWKRCRKQSRELFPEARPDGKKIGPRPFTSVVAFR